jgi:hypothetical protein
MTPPDDTPFDRVASGRPLKEDPPPPNEDDYGVKNENPSPRQRSRSRFRPRVVFSGDTKEDSVPPPPLVLKPARLPDPTTIPPRQWLYGTQLLRGFVTVLVAPGGTGKSVYAMTVAAALASGVPLLGDHIFMPVKAAILNLEDPLDELDRRLAAIMMRHQLEDYHLEDRLFMHSGEDRALAMAELDEDGFTVIHPDENALIEQIKNNDIGLIVVDPFAESHSLEENNNPQMVKAAAAWRHVARATGCAVMLVHHVRKGAVTDIDAARGAKALTDSARVGLLLSQMTEDDAKLMYVEPDERRFYVRLDNAKANLAPPGKAKWMKLEEVVLGNATRDYPKGDRVAAMVSWEPTSAFAGTTIHDLNRVLDAIAEGPVRGALYSDNKRGSGDRWVGHILTGMLQVGEEKAAAMVKTWLSTGLLYSDTYHDAEQRKTRNGVRVNNSKRPTE